MLSLRNIAINTASHYGVDGHKAVPTRVQKTAAQSGIVVHRNSDGQFELSSSKGNDALLRHMMPEDANGSLTVDQDRLQKFLSFVHQPLKASFTNDAQSDEKHIALRSFLQFITKPHVQTIAESKEHAADEHIEFEEGRIADMHRAVSSETDGKAIRGFSVDPESGFYVIEPDARILDAKGCPGANQKDLQTLFVEGIHSATRGRYAEDLPARIELTGAELQEFCKHVGVYAENQNLQLLLKGAEFEEEVQRRRQNIFARRGETRIPKNLSARAPSIESLLASSTMMTDILQSDVTKDMWHRYHWWESVRNSTTNPAEKLTHEMKVFHATLATLPDDLHREAAAEFMPLIDFSHDMLGVLRTASAEKKNSKKPAPADVTIFEQELARHDAAFAQAIEAMGSDGEMSDDAENILRDLKIFAGQRNPQSIGPIYQSTREFLREALQGAKNHPFTTMALTYLIIQTLPGMSADAAAQLAQGAAQAASHYDPVTGELILGNLDNIQGLPESMKVFKACHWNWSQQSLEYYPHCLSSDRFVQMYNSFYDTLSQITQFVPKSFMENLIELRGEEKEKFLFGNRFIEGLDWMGRKLTNVNRYQDQLHAGFWATMYILGRTLGFRKATQRLDTFLSPVINLGATTIRGTLGSAFNKFSRPSGHDIVRSAAAHVYETNERMPVYAQAFETTLNEDVQRFAAPDIKEVPVTFTSQVANVYKSTKSNLKANFFKAVNNTSDFVKQRYDALPQMLQKPWIYKGLGVAFTAAAVAPVMIGYVDQFHAFGPELGPWLERISGYQGTGAGYGAALGFFGPLNVLQDILQNHIGVGTVAAGVGGTGVVVVETPLRPYLRAGLEKAEAFTGGALRSVWNGAVNGISTVKQNVTKTARNVDSVIGLKIDHAQKFVATFISQPEM